MYGNQQQPQMSEALPWKNKGLTKFGNMNRFGLKPGIYGYTKFNGWKDCTRWTSFLDECKSKALEKYNFNADAG